MCTQKLILSHTILLSMLVLRCIGNHSIMRVCTVGIITIQYLLCMSTCIAHMVHTGSDMLGLGGEWVLWYPWALDHTFSTHDLPTCAEPVRQSTWCHWRCVLSLYSVRSSVQGQGVCYTWWIEWVYIANSCNSGSITAMGNLPKMLELWLCRSACQLTPYTHVWRCCFFQDSSIRNVSLSQ